MVLKNYNKIPLGWCEIFRELCGSGLPFDRIQDLYELYCENEEREIARRFGKYATKPVPVSIDIDFIRSCSPEARMKSLRKRKEWLLEQRMMDKHIHRKMETKRYFAKRVWYLNKIYDKVRYGKHGIFNVEHQGRCFHVDIHGDKLYPQDYDEICSFTGGYHNCTAKCVQDNKVYIINRKGDILRCMDAKEC